MPDFPMYAFNLSANSSPKPPLFFNNFHLPPTMKNAGDDGTVGWDPHVTARSYVAPQVEALRNNWLNQPSSPSLLVFEKC